MGGILLPDPVDAGKPVEYRSWMSNTDAWDMKAKEMVETLLLQELLVLSTPRSRSEVEKKLAFLLADGDPSGEDLANAIMDLACVVELYADDPTLEALLREALEDEPL